MVVRVAYIQQMEQRVTIWAGEQKTQSISMVAQSKTRIEGRREIRFPVRVTTLTSILTTHAIPKRGV